MEDEVFSQRTINVLKNNRALLKRPSFKDIQKQFYKSSRKTKLEFKKSLRKNFSVLKRLFDSRRRGMLVLNS